MSLGYADRLSHREDLGGRLGAPELSEQPRVLLAKAWELAELITSAGSTAVFTGAGISTACGIPDFRGPQGVWTLQRAGLPPPQLATSFLYATPSLTHQALLALLRCGAVRYICSQNVDGLHLRSGVPRAQLAELHGNCFAERCRKCGTEYVRDFEMETVGFKPTGRRCSAPGCGGRLADHILDWEDALPPAELKATQQHASAAGLSLCLGTSLQIVPAANLPLRTVRAGGRLAVVNLQATPKDKSATVVIHARVDGVMAVVMRRLGVPIPPYTRVDKVQLSHSLHYQSLGKTCSGSSGGGCRGDGDGNGDSSCNESLQQQQQQQAGAAQSAALDGKCSTDRGETGSWGFTLTIASVHGMSCPLPMVASARVFFTVPNDQAVSASLVTPTALCKPRELNGAPPWRVTRRVPAGVQVVQAHLLLQLVDAADQDKRVQELCYRISAPSSPLMLHQEVKQQQQEVEEKQQEPPPNMRPMHSRRTSAAAVDGVAVLEFITQERDYTRRQGELVSELEAAAASDNGGDGRSIGPGAVACPSGEATDSRDWSELSSDSNAEEKCDQLEGELAVFLQEEQDAMERQANGQNTSGRMRKRPRRLDV